jgi:hypothetical protein
MNPHPIDDDDVARLVRDVAEAWVMPPVRLDQPGWRDRVRGPRERRSATIKGWFGRMGQAATAALVLTVAAALIAVYLTGPHPNIGQSPNPSNGRAPTPTPGVAASPLPKLFLNGELPSPSKVLVQLAQMNFGVVDLASGNLGSPLTAATWGSQVHRAPGGDLVCLCNSTDGYAQGNFTHERVSLDRIDAAGSVVSRTVVVDVTGQPDPRGATSDQTGHVSAYTTFSADGRFAYVGWSARAHPSWTSGLTIVELASGSVVQRLALPDKADGSGDSRTYVDAPRVVGTAGDRVVIDRNGYTFAPASASNPNYHVSSDAFIAALSGGSLGEPTALALGTGCGNDLTFAGGLADGGLWLSCAHYDGPVLNVIRRLKPDLSLAGETSVDTASIDGSTSIVSPDGASLYAWNPISLKLTRVDLATGTSTTSEAPKPTAAVDPLRALGRWLAPTAVAKSILQAGIAISPDGSRVYALGIDGNPAGEGFVGSAGVVVFDARTLALIGRWAPTADFDSIAVSADGKLVYAAGAPDVDAGGVQTNQQASITVFDATDGTVRLIAGQLVHGTLTYADTTLR